MGLGKLSENMCVSSVPSVSASQPREHGATRSTTRRHCFRSLCPKGCKSPLTPNGPKCGDLLDSSLSISLVTSLVTEANSPASSFKTLLRYTPFFYSTYQTPSRPPPYHVSVTVESSSPSPCISLTPPSCKNGQHIKAVIWEAQMQLQDPRERGIPKQQVTVTQPVFTGADCGPGHGAVDQGTSSGSQQPGSYGKSAGPQGERGERLAWLHSNTL